MIEIFSQIELEAKAKELDTEEVGLLLNALVPHIEELLDVTIGDFTNGVQPAKGCEESTAMINRILQDRGFSTKALQGDIEISPMSWLEHYISITYLKNSWVVIDFTISQFESNKNDFLIAVLEPNQNSLRNFLIATYNWSV